MKSFGSFRFGVLLFAFALSACGGGGGDGNSTTEPSTESVEVTPTPETTTDPVAESIEAFVDDGRLKLGALGNLIFEAYPIALFKDGRALNDTTGLLYPGGLDAHRTSYPESWTQWRRSATGIEVRQSNGTWKAITSRPQPLAPEGTRRAGVYEALSVASGAGLTIITSQNYTFTNTGVIGRGSYTIGEAPGLGAISTTPNNRGTYTINGYRLSISFEDGTKEEHVIVVDARPRYLYIDGALYVLKDS
jgi:hypothetical protein